MGQTRPSPPATSTGQPLPPPLRHALETQTGADLSDVRVHRTHAPHMLGAHAYTHGTDIHIAPDAPHVLGSRGQALLAHEAWHVVQQAQGRVRPLPGTVDASHTTSAADAAKIIGGDAGTG